MASHLRSKVIAVENLGKIDSSDIPKSGIIDSRFILFSEMDDETLHLLYENGKELIIEKRPDWVKKHYPKEIN